MKKIIIPDISTGNKTSLMRAAIAATKETGMQVVKLSNPAHVKKNDIILLPGVGDYGVFMKQLVDTNWSKTINKHVLNGGRLVGICVGFQALFESSEESLNINGLGLLKGKVVKMPLDRLPLIGYQSVVNDKMCKIGEFYCIHAYALENSVVNINPLAKFLYYKYNHKNIIGGVKFNNIIGFQFHPEKSGMAGIRLLSRIFSGDY